MARKYVPIAYNVAFILLGITLVVKFMGWVDIPSIADGILILVASILFFWNAMLSRKKSNPKNNLKCDPSSMLGN